MEKSHFRCIERGHPRERTRCTIAILPLFWVRVYRNNGEELFKSAGMPSMPPPPSDRHCPGVYYKQGYTALYTKGDFATGAFSKEQYTVCTWSQSGGGGDGGRRLQKKPSNNNNNRKTMLRQKVFYLRVYRFFFFFFGEYIQCI